ncbi:MAG: FAD-dependent oxidoreductase [Clostridia bacterium]|nr:FAD-dependent oxidoreductase [Clostridia bacterium]
MKFERDIAVKNGYDVIVVGSGPAGIAAAVTAGRNGVKTLLVESQGRVGGTATAGFMSHWTGTVGNKIYWEILKRHNLKCGKDEKSIWIDPELLTITYIEMLEEAGVDMLLYTTVCDVVMDEKTVKGVVCCNKNGLTCYTAKVVIDASGDGDVAFKAGAEFTLGRESDGKMQPATLMFKVGGVDMKRAVLPGSFETLVPTEKGELQALAKEKLPYPAGHVLLMESPTEGVVTCNMTNAIDIDGTKVEDLTRAEVTCRKQLMPIVEFLREYAPGYENCYIVGSASLIGIRETRHFKGLYTLTEQDILDARKFKDFVVYGAHFNFDVHNISGAGLDETGSQNTFKQEKGYTIPYKCLIPEVIDGLLLSGRNISGTHMAHSNFRAMPICAATGEAAGIAAALSVKGGVLPRCVTAEEIQKYL